ncbi:MAG: hypothetical protein GC154_11520 [bacterium]|nr:hypothetical protein [bacterium]
MSFLLALLWLIFVFWWDSVLATLFSDFGPEYNRRFVFTLAWAHMAVVALYVPFQTASVIAGERENKTFEMLASSPLSVLNIVLSKTLAPMGYIMLLMAAGAPFMTISLIGQGVSLDDILAIYLALFSAGLSLGALGLWASTWRPRVFQTIWITAALLVAMFVLVPYHRPILSVFVRYQFVDAFSMLNPSSRFGMGQQWLLLNPFSVLYQLQYPNSNYTPVMDTIVRHWIGYGIDQRDVLPISGAPVVSAVPVVTSLTVAWDMLFVHLLVAIFFYGWALFRVRKLARFEGRVRKARTPDERPPQTLWQWLLRDIESDVSKRFASDSAGVLLEGRSQRLGRGSALVRIGYLCVMLALLGIPVISRELTTLMLILPLTLALIFTAPLSATRISIERENDTLDLLRVTLLTPAQLVKSKLNVCMRYALIIAYSLAVPWFFFRVMLSSAIMPGASRWHDLAALLTYMAMMFLFLRMTAALGLGLSAAFHNSRVPVILIVLFSVIVPFGVFFAKPLLLGAAPSLFFSARIARWILGLGMVGLGYLLMLLNPLTVIPEFYPDRLQDMMNMPDSFIPFRIERDMNIFYQRHPLSADWVYSGLAHPIAFGLIQIAFYLAVAYLALRWSENRLRRDSG